MALMSKRALIRFYAELNDFLPPNRRFTRFEHSFTLAPSVKDVVESLGVPHTEVDLIVANGDPVAFSYRVRPGDRISVYPVFESIDLSDSATAHRRPLRATRFVLDVHLGRLARYLRLFGLDTLYRNDYVDEELVALAEAERRLLLTRDVGVLKRGDLSRGYFVRAVRPRLQIVEVLTRFDLFGAVDPFTRCVCCNGVLRKAAEAEVARGVPPRARAAHEDFRVCAECERIYWPGSHHKRMTALVEEVMRSARLPHE
jgi:uncharacterized protein with PIN domain